jgi:hypothetical protein
VRGGSKRLLDGRPNSFQIFEDVVVPKADHAEALAFEVRRSLSISFGGVLSTIDLDNQAEFWAEEIDDIAVDFDLAAKFEAIVLTGAKHTPQRPFGVGRVPTQLSRSAGQMMLSCHGVPSPRRFAPTLSRGGERVFAELRPIYA